MPAAAAEVDPDPEVARVVAAVDDQRLMATVTRLAAFGTRNLYSGTGSATRGTGAARAWIADELRKASPRMQVLLDRHRLAAQGGRLATEVDLVNVVGVLPGRSARRIIVSGHYDSVAKGPDGQIHWDQGDLPAPGANDDGSGTAAVLEMARLLGSESLEATVVFVAFDGEEEGLVGSSLYAERAARQHEPIFAVLNNDIIGSEEGGSGRVGNTTVNVYSNGPNDSISRELALYVEWIGERFVPVMDVRPIFRYDRFGRGGDHTPFDQKGFAAIRFTVSEENYERQHDLRDSPDGVSARYLGRVARVNAAALTSLALAPPTPVVTDDKGRPLLDRGESGYDARLRWELPEAPPDLAGFEILMRDTTSSRWEKTWLLPAGAREKTLPGVLIDTVTLGVRSVDRDGNRSLAGVYSYPPREMKEYQIRPQAPVGSGR
jgi:hypothetical protein